MVDSQTFTFCLTQARSGKLIPYQTAMKTDSETKACNIPSGKLTYLLKIAIYSEFYHQKWLYKWWFSIVMLVYQRVPCKHFPVRLSEFAPNRKSPPVSHEKSHFLSATLANVLHIRQTLVPPAQNININISSAHQNLGARVKKLYTPNWSKFNLTTTNTINTHGPLADLVVTPVRQEFMPKSS